MARKKTKTTKKGEQLVRYVSPFGSPAWMTRAKAREHLAEDDARYVRWQKLGILSEEQRRVGAPRIEGS